MKKFKNMTKEEINAKAEDMKKKTHDFIDNHNEAITKGIFITIAGLGAVLGFNVARMIDSKAIDECLKNGSLIVSGKHLEFMRMCGKTKEANHIDKMAAAVLDYATRNDISITATSAWWDNMEKLSPELVKKAVEEVTK